MPATRRWFLLCTPLAAGALVVTVVHDNGTTASPHRLGPSITAETRDLATTLTAPGNLQRNSESVVSYTAALSEEPPSATLTSLLDVGATATRGTVLYTANEQPVVALVGDLPAWRALTTGIDAGTDVQQLEENLVALGYDPGTVDQRYTTATARAVKTWETDLGRTAPDGEVSLGDVVFLTAPGDVLGHEAAVGDPLEPGAPVLTVGSEQRVVVAAVDATAAGGWPAGATVVLEWSDTTTTQGTVVGTGRDVTDGQVELTIALGTDVGDRRSGAAVTATLVGAQRTDVVAVPVAALVDDAGSSAVRVARPDGADGDDDIVPVETGLVADGWVEITAGLDAGEEVRLPG